VDLQGAVICPQCDAAVPTQECEEIVEVLLVVDQDPNLRLAFLLER
jgi:hypothetical protein